MFIVVSNDFQRMAFSHCRWFQLLQQTHNDLLGNRVRPPFVLRQNGSDRRLKVNNLNSRPVNGEEFNPSLPHLPRDICRVEREVAAGAKMLAALLTGGLDDFALVISRINIERVADGIQRNNGQRGSVLGEPGVFARARKPGRERDA